jgi:hypothetical protein
MIKQNNSACAVGKQKSRANSQFLTHGPLSLGVSRVVPRLILIPLVCAAMFSIATSRTLAAAAAVQVPYKDSYVVESVGGVINPDGSRDVVLAGVGTNTHGGTFTVVVQLHLDPVEFFSDFALRPFAGTETVTVSNGDNLVSTIAGAEEAPLPLAPPFGLSGSQTITGGTGRFSGATGSLTFTGLDFNDGTASFTTTGTISTVGSNK